MTRRNKTRRTINDTKLFYNIILPIMTCFFAYASLGSWIDSNLEIEDLKRITGTVENYSYGKSSTQYSTYTHLNLKLNNKREYKITSEWNSKFSKIVDEIRKDNRIELYHRKPHQRLYRLGTENIIYQLKVGNSLILDIEERQNKSNGLVYFTGIIALIGATTLTIRKLKKTTANRLA